MDEASALFVSHETAVGFSEESLVFPVWGRVECMRVDLYHVCPDYSTN